MHSDFALLLLDLPPWELALDELEEGLGVYIRPYPLGLWTEAGFVVANPALSGDPIEVVRFDRHHYHGSVVWGWQLALLEAALLRWRGHPQLVGRRRELVEELLSRLEALKPEVAGVAHEELWTWRVDATGALRPVAYGLDAASATESNALQLWSLVPLANTLGKYLPDP
jgi:hypothetical protein